MTSDNSDVLRADLLGPLPPARVAVSPRTVLIGVIVIAVLYAVGISPHWWLGRDSGLYLSLARNLARGEGYQLAGEPHTLVPPGFPMMLAAIMKSGGSFLAMNVAIAVMALLSICLVWRMLREITAPSWALLLTLAVALSKEMYERSGELLSDIPFMLVVTAALWLYYRGLAHGKCGLSWEVASVLLAGACWIRMAGIPLVVGAAVGLVLSAKGRRGRAMLNALLVAVLLAGSYMLFTLYVRHAYAGREAATYTNSIRAYGLTGLYHGFNNFLTATTQLSRLYTAQSMPVAMCMLIWVVPVLVAMARRMLKGDFVGPSAVISYVGGICALASLRTRYLLPISPLLLLYLAEGWWLLLTRAARLRTEKASIVTRWIIIIAIAMNIPLVGRFIWYRHSSDYLSKIMHGDFRYVEPVVEFLKGDQTPGAMLAMHAVGYLSDRPVLVLPASLNLSTPSPDEIRRILKAQNIRYVVFDARANELPFYRTLREYLAEDSEPVYSFEKVTVYRIRAE